MNDLSQLEWACKEFYTTEDASVRVQAEKTCTSLCARHDCIATSQTLLQRADSCYSQFIAATALTKFISNKETVTHVKTRLELRNFVLNYLATQTGLESFVQQALILLVCRITKLGWFDKIDKGSEFPFQDLLTSATTFIQTGQISGILIGVQLLSNLVTEISQTKDTDHTKAILFIRKLSISFRDTLLFPIFQLGLGLLRETNANLKTLNSSDQDQVSVVQHCLKLALSCLSYDFIGTSVGSGATSYDDTGNSVGDDLATVQLPTTWRPVFLDPFTIQLFFQLFAGLPTHLRPLTLCCLVQMSSIRRSLFSNVERQAFLISLVSGVLGVLREHSESLHEPSVYHEFCRLLSRLKCNFQLNELMQVDDYAYFIRLLGEFTVHSLQHYSSDTNNNNSVHYLLVLWQRLVASIPYVRTSEPYLVDTYAPQVTRAFIQSRLDAVPSYSDDPYEDSVYTSSTRRQIIKQRQSIVSLKRGVTNKGGGDTNGNGVIEGIAVSRGQHSSIDVCPLDDVMTLMQQLDQFAIIGRCEYEKSCEIIGQFFDVSASNLQSELEQLASVGPSNFNPNNVDPTLMQAIRLEENRLAWLVYMIGSLIGGRTTLANSSEADELDGQLISRVLQLMRLIDMRLMLIVSSVSTNQSGSNVAAVLCSMSAGAVRLELAILNFLEQFRHMYVGENVSRVSRIYQSLSISVGISSEDMILRVFAAKILSNLRYWSAHEAVLQPTLALLGELASGYSAMRKLLRLEDIQFMIMNHTPENFRFLMPSEPDEGQATMLRAASSCYRTEFYAYLSRLLLVDLVEDDATFLTFLAPLTQIANSLISNLLLSETCPISQQQARNSIIGLARDLAGVAFSLNSKTSFQMFLDWFYPSCFSLFDRALELWPFDPLVTSPILKLLAEVAHNRNGRLLFDATLPMGYLILAEMTKILTRFGYQLIPFFSQVPTESLYSHKLKPLIRCINALKSTLGGTFANFAVFGLIGDDSFEKSVRLGTDLLMCVTEEELRGFTKMGKAYFSLLEYLTQNHMVLISSLDPSVLRRLFDAIKIGVDSLETSILWSSCFCLDHILTHIYKLLNAPSHNQSGEATNGGGNCSPPYRLLFVPQQNSTTNPTGPSVALAARLRLASLPPDQRDCGATGALAIWSLLATQGNSNLRRMMTPTTSDGRREIDVVFRYLLVTFLAAFMNDECKNQWGMSRPLLGLILLNQEYFASLRDAVINAVSPNKQADVKGLFDKLMEDVEVNLLAKNRDKFTQNISSFRHAMTEFMKSASVKPMTGQLNAMSADGICDESFSLRSILISTSGLSIDTVVPSTLL